MVLNFMKYSEFLLMYKKYSMMLFEIMARKMIAKLFLYDEKAIENTSNKHGLSYVKSLDIDEISFKKGYNYTTLGIDSNKHAVIDVKTGKKKNTIKELAKKLKNKGGECDHIVSITSDISQEGLATIDEQFLNAKLVIDKFHIKLRILRTLDEVSKEEQRKSKQKQAFFKGRRLFIITEKRMFDQQKAKLSKLCSLYPKIARTYSIVTPLDDFYNATTPHCTTGCADVGLCQ